jgi:hypothetical protein
LVLSCVHDFLGEQRPEPLIMRSRIMGAVD